MRQSIVILAGVGVAALLLLHPPIALAAVGAAGLVSLGLASRRSPTPLWLGLLAAVLAGYAFFGRGFAYLGVRPIYVGEAVLFSGLLLLAVDGSLRASLRHPIAWLLVGFAAWCGFRTLPYLDAYGFVALRDAVIFGYGAFALMVAGALLRHGLIDRIPGAYRRFVPWLLVWLPLALYLTTLSDALPHTPGSDVPIVATKPGDAAVHLAGAATFLMLFGGRPQGRGERHLSWLPEVGAWVLIVTGVVMSASWNRGGLLAFTAACMTVVVLRPASRWWKLLLTGALLGGTILLADLRLGLGDRRPVSARQLAANLASVFEDRGPRDLQGTKEWRLRWWGDILDYTVSGPHFWTGKGFGVNLADDDGYQVEWDNSLRSPHNGHLTILARAGVPGFLLWVVLQGAFGTFLLLGFLRSRWVDPERAALLVWILAYWVAFLINASFDVFLEGPQGGIWFWSLMGLGMAVLMADAGGRARLTGPPSRGRRPGPPGRRTCRPSRARR